ncbi:MAG: glycosyltransferase family 2 protein [Actinobacteria bacterium]|nr:glycosyltransferase family 2 protein [Actinomycetota bacterium]
MPYDLSIIIACYNEEAILEKSISELEAAMSRTKYKYELIFIDDCSQDNTRELIKRISSVNNHMRYIFHEKNVGRGGTVCEGIRTSEGKIVGFLDIDLEVHARYIPSMVQAIEEGYDISTAYRLTYLRFDSIMRDLSSKAYHSITRHFLKIPLNDTETGFKFFNREKILPVIEKTQDKRWFWDTEVMAFAYFNNLKINEIPCLFIRRKDKKSTVRLWDDSIEYIRKVLQFKRKMKKDGILTSK